MIERLKAIEEKYNKLQAQLSDPNIYNDMEKIKNLSKESSDLEETVVTYHRYNEVIKNIGTVLSRDPATLNMKTLVEIMKKQPAERDALCKIHDELERTLKTLVTINDRNKLLIEQSLEMIDFNINLIQSTRMSPGVSNYTRGACEDQATSRGTGMFDAKQ